MCVQESCAECLHHAGTAVSGGTTAQPKHDLSGAPPDRIGDDQPQSVRRRSHGVQAPVRQHPQSHNGCQFDDCPVAVHRVRHPHLLTGRT
jgi:hypothetical protein